MSTHKDQLMYHVRQLAGQDPVPVHWFWGSCPYTIVSRSSKEALLQTILFDL